MFDLTRLLDREPATGGCASSGDSGKESFLRKLSRYGHLFCIKHDIFSSQSIQGDLKGVSKFYDFFAPFYDLIFPRSAKYRSSAAEVAGNYVKDGDVVLDLGTGTGILTLNMLEKDVEIHTYDLHPKMLKRARKKIDKKARRDEIPRAHLPTYCRGNAAVLPYKDRVFDVVCSALMMVYLDEEQKNSTVREIHRVLKPEGHVVFLTCQGELHKRFYPRDKWIALLERNGFQAPTVVDFNDIFRIISAEKLCAGEERTN